MPDILQHPENYEIKFSTTIPTAHWVIPYKLFTRRARFSMRPLPKANLSFDWRGLPQGTEPRRQTDGTVQLEVADVPAFEEEEFMPPEDTLKSRVDFYYAIGYLGGPSSFWPDFKQVDLRLSRKFYFRERWNLEAIADVFNLFNRFNVADVNPLSDPTDPAACRAGEPTAALDPRQFQFALKISW